MLSTFLNAILPLFLASCKVVNHKIIVQMRLFLCKCEISLLVYPKPAVICCFIVSEWRKIAPLALGAFGANLDIFGPASRIIFFRT